MFKQTVNEIVLENCCMNYVLTEDCQSIFTSFNNRQGSDAGMSLVVETVHFCWEAHTSIPLPIPPNQHFFNEATIELIVDRRGSDIQPFSDPSALPITIYWVNVYWSLFDLFCGCYTSLCDLIELIWPCYKSSKVHHGRIARSLVLPRVSDLNFVRSWCIVFGYNT